MTTNGKLITAREIDGELWVRAADVEARLSRTHAADGEAVNAEGPAHLCPEPAPGFKFDERGVLVRDEAAQQQAEPESVIKRQAQKIGELIADRDSWIEAHARLYRLYHDQSPKVGEEIHVNVEGGDVYTLPLQRSGMDKPRFVVHVPCSPQAEPGADERVLTDQEIADLGPGEVTTWAYEDMFYFARKIEGAVLAQSGQRSGVAEDANLLRDAAEKGLDINQQPQLGCVEVWAGKGDDALVFREYYSGHADREAATKCALKRALAAPTQQEDKQ